MYLLSQGSWVRVLSPQILVEDLKEETKKITNILNSLRPFVKNGGEIMLYTSWVQTPISESIEAAARDCGWGTTKSHDKQNAFMLTMQRQIW